ncbi:Mannosylfructose-phosphate synthase [Providencia rustigianii]|nr:Mannosylfructose-phosphate synthase [Providencia rustigianii]
MEPTFSNCLDYVKNNGLDELVIFKGKVTYSALPDLYRNCELFIFPSSCENCPNILLEAIGCGAPVIVSKTNPMPEFAKDAALYIDEHQYKRYRKKNINCPVKS